METETSPEYPNDALGDSWGMVGDSRPDPWQTPQGDPWRKTAAATGSQFPLSGDAHPFEPQWTLSRDDLGLPGVPEPGAGWPRTYSGGGVGHEAHRDGGPPAHRFAMDNPPTWDGKHPQTQAEPYFKKLRGWLLTTRTLKTQQGMLILSSCTTGSDLELIVNEIPLETLLEEMAEKLYMNTFTKLTRSTLNCQ